MMFRLAEIWKKAGVGEKEAQDVSNTYLHG
jgi:hypothetical protein